MTASSVHDVLLRPVIIVVALAAELHGAGTSGERAWAAVASCGS